MTSQIPLSNEDLARLEEAPDGLKLITPDLAYRRLSMVNVVFWGNPATSDDWVLIDTGLPASASTIVECAERRFGGHTRPRAIIMTHAHFDHAGSVEALSRRWDVPVYAHPLEFPYLNGEAYYPPADPGVGGGVMALLSPLFPRSPMNVGKYLSMLPADGSVPYMPGWTWLHTPGHAPGHVSLWRQGDRALIAGDAFVTTGQESAYEVALQTPEMHGPPRYFTPDWAAAEASVKRLAALEPEIAVTGRGVPVQGAGMRAALHRLARDFQEIAVPPEGHRARAAGL
ncbi:MBL fold metallo-hydrolase [Rhizobium sp. CSW-27]|uniref:MBL fold metallo-hydrolase n=1 Tax=Rhizobium sp. CSW-27 TaxID=2839985 RepID=UPI001C025419|nr:MBL fold metallo-hydrolase [Rhizobium sp. CSW-27]MBT9372727.1 MBL fold metallo-hydrolase [Rhizobium sp. CSW-27]